MTDFSATGLLLHAVSSYGLWFVFVCVLLDQGGLPLVPGYPPIIVSAAAAVDVGHSVWPILAIATVAAVTADWLWFLGGRRFGDVLLRLMRRLQVAPLACLASAGGDHCRWGPSSLLVAKFIPGFSALATMHAAERRTSTRRFLLFDACGAALWSGVAVGLGVAFHTTVGQVLARLDDIGHLAVPAIACAMALFLAWRMLAYRRHSQRQSISEAA
jgi:membrane protein DedA with SNARE-associated domain